MAALATDQITVLWSDGSCDREALLALKNATAGDTADLSPWFRVIKRAGLVSVTGTHIAALTFTGTTVTVPAGPANDGLLAIVVGVAV